MSDNSGSIALKVERLTKKFGPRTALDDVSFEVGAGETVGLLGPNGAGKTTAMRIIAGYLPATAGRVEIFGVDAAQERLEAVRGIGYFQENLFIYPEMRVEEYLVFRAGLKGFRGKRARERIEEVEKTCGLTGAGRSIIGTLSLGFRRRTALAECLLGDPGLLVLDDPTSGLDAAQAEGIREFIMELSERRAVLLSTHSPREAETICTRAVILNKGKILADDAPEVLIGKIGGNMEIRAEIHGPYHSVLERLSELPGVLRVTCRPDETGLESGEADDIWAGYDIECLPGGDLRVSVFESAARNGWALRELNMTRRSMGDVLREFAAGAGRRAERG